MKKISLLMTFIFSFLNAIAQDSGVEMANALRSSGKIYVVVAVISVIFIGLFVYLFSIDKRLKKIEQENKH